MKALLLFGCASAAALVSLALDTPAPSGPGPATGTVTGMISWDGERPEPLKALDIGAEAAKGCCPAGEEMNTVDRTLRIGEKSGIADVVLFFEPKSGEVERKIPEEPFRMDQQSCRFEPHVLVVPTGATVAYHNSDQVAHNVHTISKKNPAFNLNVAADGKEERVVKMEENIKVTCDIHPWMGSWVVVTDDFFGKTEPDGSLNVTLPPGEYEVSYWHEKLGKGSFEDITVAEGATVEIEEKLEESKGGGRRRRR